MITNQNFIKCKNKYFIFMVVGVVLFVVGLLLFFIGGSKQVDNEKNAVYFNEILESDDKNKSGKYSYLEVFNDAYRFAQYGENDDYCYFVYDDNYYYIVRMSEKDYEKYFKEGLEKVRIEGTVYEITDEIKNLAIEEFNSAYEEDFINSVNFKDYFGDVYLNLNNTTGSNAVIYFVFAVFFVITGITIALVNLIFKIKFGNTMKKLSEMELTYINNELNSSDTVYLPKFKLFLTNNYIVNFSGNFFILKYSDIIWMYPYDHYVNSIKTNHNIMIMDRFGKKYSLAHSAFNSRKNETNSVWNYITNKNQNILLGFSIEYENLTKSMVNNNRNNVM